MSDPTGAHTRYDELAAGYSLHALDPEDEQLFLRHLPDCPRCRAALSDFTEVAAALAENWPAVEPSPRLGARIMAAAAREPAARNRDADLGDARLDDTMPDDTMPDDTVSPAMADLAERRRRRLRKIAAGAAAAAVLAAGGTTWGVLSAGGGPVAPASGCVRAGTCREVVLTDARSHAPAGKVIVADGTVWLIPSGLPADNTARQVYVLWQITGGRTPVAVGSFDVRGHGNQPVRIGGLAVPYRGTWAFRRTDLNRSSPAGEHSRTDVHLIRKRDSDAEQDSHPRRRGPRGPRARRRRLRQQRCHRRQRQALGSAG
ncbi:MAG: hypothetical protein ACRDNZ_03985 [Streptosporangiaceae bacterium]